MQPPPLPPPLPSASSPYANPYAAPVARLQEFDTGDLVLASRGTRLGAAIVDNIILLVPAVVIVAAGMEGALPSVVGGLVSAPVIAVLASYGLDAEQAYVAALEFWSAIHGFVLLEMTGVMDDVDADAVFSDMVLRLSVGLQKR